MRKFKKYLSLGIAVLVIVLVYEGSEIGDTDLSTGYAHLITYMMHRIAVGCSILNVRSSTVFISRTENSNATELVFDSKRPGEY